MPFAVTAPESVYVHPVAPLLEPLPEPLLKPLLELPLLLELVVPLLEPLELPPPESSLPLDVPPELPPGDGLDELETQAIAAADMPSAVDTTTRRALDEVMDSPLNAVKRKRSRSGGARDLGYPKSGEAHAGSASPVTRGRAGAGARERRA